MTRSGLGKRGAVRLADAGGEVDAQGRDVRPALRQCGAAALGADLEGVQFGTLGLGPLARVRPSSALATASAS